mmetsp:Transcript_1039/g.1718  ORF Transcript_1039/g.1718 Transcript_1039/m.1718 type:complete len:156 (+) Transcript_1039:33-500(+)
MSEFTGSGSSESQILVDVEFFIPGKELNKHISIDNNSIVPADLNEISPESRASNTRCEYSGRHDHGDLPKLKSAGPGALLIAALQQAKQDCDQYLTECIDSSEGGKVVDTKTPSTDQTNVEMGEIESADGELSRNGNNNDASTEKEESQAKKLRV